MADKYPHAPYPNYGAPAPPSAPPQVGMPYPQYYPPPSYDAAMRGQQMYPPQPQQQQQPMMNQGYGFQPVPPQHQHMQPMQPQMPQAQYYPPMPPGVMPYHPTGPMGAPSHQPQGYFNGAGGVAPVTAVFDSGARYNLNGSITVPPPPPGYMPNAAQLAAMNGQSVHVQKEKNGFFSGGKGAGFTFW